MKGIRRLFTIGMTCLIILTVGMTIYAKAHIRSVNYEELKKESQYSVVYKPFYEAIYRLHDFFIDDKVKTVTDLEALSPYILVVEVSENPTYKGLGMLDNCTVKKVIKGDNFKSGMKIKIYELVGAWTSFATIYLSGSTPLKVGDTYLVFLKEASNANVKGAYIFTSIKYGHFNLSLDSKKVEERFTIYEDSISLDEAEKYDYMVPGIVIGLEDNKTEEELIAEQEKEIEEYKKVANEVYEKFFDKEY